MAGKGPELSQEPGMQPLQKGRPEMQQIQIITNVQIDPLIALDRGRYVSTDENRLDGGKVRSRPGAE